VKPKQIVCAAVPILVLGAWVAPNGSVRTLRVSVLGRPAEAAPAGPRAPNGTAPAPDGPYRIVAIDAPGSVGTLALGINDGGQIVGAYADTAHPECLTTLRRCHGFLMDRDTFVTIDVPGAMTTFAQGLNDQGQIVGQYLDAAGVNRGFLLEDGEFTQIDAPDALVTSAEMIDDKGQIVGIFDDGPDPSLSRHGFLLVDDDFSPIDFPGASSTSHLAMNDGGQIVGDFFDGHRFHGFFLDGDDFTQLDVPAAAETSAEGINDRGQIVGQFFVELGGQPRGFVQTGSDFVPLDAPMATYTIAEDINDSGVIVGQFQSVGGTLHGFVATPNPQASPRPRR